MALARLNNTEYTVANEREAIEALANGASEAHLTKAMSPLVTQAAGILIDMDNKGLPTNIESYGAPVSVLEDVGEKLSSIGAPLYVSQSIIEALSQYATNMGADFTREAQAKPLYARIMVTNQKPTDLMECDLVQSTLINGAGRLDDGVSQRVMQATIYGTQTSATKLDVTDMLGRDGNKYLLIYYGSPSHQGGSQFTTLDRHSINLVQGMAQIIPPDMIEVLDQAMRSLDSQSPELAIVEEILQDFADLAKVTEAYAISENLPPDIRQVITEQIGQIAQKISMMGGNFSLPPIITAAMNLALNNTVANRNLDIGFMRPAANDSVFNMPNQEIDSQLSNLDTLIEQLVQLSNEPNISEANKIKVKDIVLSLQQSSSNTATVPEILGRINLVLMDMAVNPSLPPSTFLKISEIVRAIPTIQSSPSALLLDNQNPMASIQMAQGIDTTLALVKQLAATAKTIDNPSLITPEAMAVLNTIISLEKSMVGQSDVDKRALIMAAISNRADPLLSMMVQETISNFSNPIIVAELQKVLIDNAGTVGPVTLSSAIQALSQYRTNQAVLVTENKVQTFIRQVEDKILQSPTSSNSVSVMGMTIPITDAQKILMALKSGDTNVLLQSPQFSQVTQKLPALIDMVATREAIRQINSQQAVVSQDRAIQPSLKDTVAADLKETIQQIMTGGLQSVVATQPTNIVLDRQREGIKIVEALLRQSPAVAEAVAITSVIRQLEIASEAGKSLAPVTADIQKIIRRIETEGMAALPQILQANLSVPANQNAGVQPIILNKPLEALIAQSPKLAETVALAAVIARVERVSLNSGNSVLPTQLVRDIQEFSKSLSSNSSINSGVNSAADNGMSLVVRLMQEPSGQRAMVETLKSSPALAAPLISMVTQSTLVQSLAQKISDVTLPAETRRIYQEAITTIQNDGVRGLDRLPQTPALQDVVQEVFQRNEFLRLVYADQSYQTMGQVFVVPKLMETAIETFDKKPEDTPPFTSTPREPVRVVNFTLPSPPINPAPIDLPDADKIKFIPDTPVINRDTLTPPEKTPAPEAYVSLEEKPAEPLNPPKPKKPESFLPTQPEAKPNTPVTLEAAVQQDVPVETPPENRPITVIDKSDPVSPCGKPNCDCGKTFNKNATSLAGKEDVLDQPSLPDDSKTPSLTHEFNCNCGLCAAKAQVAGAKLADKKKIISGFDFDNV
jgi:hypothetical protein